MPKSSLYAAGPTAITVIDKYEPADKYVYAHWTPETYTITYHLNNNEHFTATGSVPTTWNYEVSDVTLPNEDEIVRAHYIFAGWHDNASLAGDVYTIVSKNRGENIDLWPAWTPITYDINYIVAPTGKVGQVKWKMGYVKPEHWTYDVEDVTLPTIEHITRDHYTFAGWYDNASFTGEVYTIISKTTGDNIDMYAKWIPDTYTITFDLQDIRATWSEAYHPISSWIYDEDSEASITLPVLGNVINKDYTFKGWYIDTSFADFKKIEAVPLRRNSSVTVYAKWEANTYDIEYELNNGSWIKSRGWNQEHWIFEKQGATLPNQTYLQREHYIFAGWYDNSSLTGDVITEVPSNTSGGTTGKIKFYAKWDPVHYQITYDMDGAEFNSDYNQPTEWAYGIASVSLPTKDNITKHDYTFKGWFKNQAKTDGPITEIGRWTGDDVKVYAKWEVNTYEVRYDLDGGFFATTSVIPRYWVWNQSGITLPTSIDVYKTHYTFKGWYTDPGLGEEYLITTIPKNTSCENTNFYMTVYARWDYNTHVIEYELNGGGWKDSTYEPPVGWTYALEDIDLPPSDTLIRMGYTFEGWFDNENLTGDKYTVLDKYTDEDMTFYVKWKEIPKSGGGGGGGGVIPGGMGENITPGQILKDVDLPDTIAYSAINSVGKKGAELIRDNEAVKFAIMLYPPSILAVRDLVGVVTKDTPDAEVFSNIVNSMINYPIQSVYTWNKEYQVAEERVTIYDRTTMLDYEMNMANIKNEWIGKYDVSSGRIKWCHYDQYGMRVKGIFYNNDAFYYLDKEGYMLIGNQLIDGQVFYFNENRGADEGKLVVPPNDAMLVQKLSAIIMTKSFNEKARPDFSIYLEEREKKLMSAPDLMNISYVVNKPQVAQNTNNLNKLENNIESDSNDKEKKSIFDIFKSIGDWIRKPNNNKK